MDSFYLSQAELTGPHCVWEAMIMRALILPPLSTVRRSTFEKIKRVPRSRWTGHRSGHIARNSMETGEDDPELEKACEFSVGIDRDRVPYSVHKNQAGGRAYFIPGKVAEALKWNLGHGSSDVREIARPGTRPARPSDPRKGSAQDLRVLEDPPMIWCSTTWFARASIYWIVNDSNRQRTNTLLLSLRGDVQRWQADTGDRSSIYHRSTPDGTEVRLAP